MERDRTLRFTPVDHPDAQGRRIVFDPTDPYVEQRWSAVVGSSATLRRLPTLWVARVPAEIDTGELSRSMGLGAGVGERSRLASTLERLVTFDHARPTPHGAGLDVAARFPPLPPRHLARLTEWTRAAGAAPRAHLTQVDDSVHHRANVVSISA